MKIEYYEKNGEECRSLGGEGDAAQFGSEMEFLNYFAEKASAAGGLGEKRYAIIEEGMSAIAIAKNEDSSSPTEMFGLRSNESINVGKILEEFGTEA